MIQQRREDSSSLGGVAGPAARCRGKVVVAVGTCRRIIAFAERIFLSFLRNERDCSCIYTIGMIQLMSPQGHLSAPSSWRKWLG